MKITIEIPDTTVCAFFDYVFVADEGKLGMVSTKIDSNDIQSGEAIVCDPVKREKDGGADA